MGVGEKVRYYRKKLRMTQKEVADKADMSRTYYADVERGRYNPSLHVLRRIATALDTNADILIAENNINENNKIENRDSDFIDQLIKQLIDDGIIKSVNDIDKETEAIILNAVKTYIALQIKKRTN